MESGSADVRPLAAEEEALKRSTDCVYFLASPLTCKKGVECEFRHSDVARLNPRGCRYWLSGNCLNPNCPFRHPPLLDGPPSPAPQVAAPVQALALQTTAYNSNKQSVPCYYFQKGHCLKGDKCPFMHWPQPTGNPPSQPSTKASTTFTDSSQMIKDPWAVKQCTSQSNTPKINVDRPVELSSSSANLVLKPETTNNGQAMARNFQYHPPADMHPRSQVTKFPKHQSENVHPRLQVSKFPNHPSDNVHPTAQPTKVPVGSSVDLSRPRNFPSHSATEQLKKGRESTKFLGMSSAFNLLVENNAEDSGHFDNNDDHVRKLVEGRRKMDHVDGFSYQHRDHKPAMEFERDQLNKMREYNQHEHRSDTYGRDQQNSSERIVDRTYTPERRVLQRKDGAEEMGNSDLRHRLLKQRKLNSSRTAVSPECRGEPHQRNNHYGEERYRQHNLRGDLPDYHLRSSISNRLQGRITNPMRSSPDRSIDVRSERERERRRLESRSSPVRRLSHQGRHGEGIKRKIDEILPSDGRSFGDTSVRIEAADPLNFAGPKSLAELKGAKVSVSAQGRQPIKRTDASASHEHKSGNLEKLAGHQEPEASLLFEGPKPLSTILKRKRKTASENGASSSSRDELNQSDQEVVNGNSVAVVIPNMQSDPVHNSGEHGDKMVDNDYEEEEEDEEGQICADSGELIDGQYSAEEIPESAGVMGENIEEQALEDSDHRESIKTVGFKTEDDEDDGYQNADDEDMDDDDDDDDDFARKVSLMFS